jgi:hypothetical protein
MAVVRDVMNRMIGLTVLLACAPLACARRSPAADQIRPESDAALVATAPATPIATASADTSVADASAGGMAIPVDAAADAAPHVPTTTLAIAGRFAVDYPTATFRVVSLPRGAVLRTSVFEHYMDQTYPFEIELRLAPRSVVDEVRAMKYGTPIFSSADELSFQEQPGFAERRTTASGLGGYVVSMGVEGVGQIDTFFPVSAKETLHVTCRYCCGLVPAPKVPREEQERVCDEVVGSLRRR